MIKKLSKALNNKEFNPINHLKKDYNSNLQERSNVIQYDCMGSPLRLCIDSKGKQVWLDTTEKEGDVVLKWEEVK